MKTSELYETITKEIVEELQAGTIPWLKPWKDNNPMGLPANAVTKRPYSGINIFLLWRKARRDGFSSSYWLTFNQATSQGATIRKGEKGTHIVFTKQIAAKREGDEEGKKIQLLRTFCVFNLDQTEGLPRENDIVVQSESERHESAERFIKATQADIRYGGDEACYIPTLDRILMPLQEQFQEQHAFYSVTLHELGHWTGARHRLNRDLSSQSSPGTYAFEELVAELTSAFLSAHLSIVADLRHAGYIDHYLKVLKADNRAFFRAAAKAQEAADYLRSFTETEQAS